MAWSAAALGAQEIADATANYPCLVGIHAGDSIVDARWNETGSLADDDTSETGYPASNAADRRGDVPTKPDAAASTWYWMIDLGAAAADFDMAAIFGHNFGTIGGLTVTLEIADDNAFTSGHETIATWTPLTSNTRLVSYALFHTGADALRYSGVRYARLKITGASGTPQVGEVWLGRRRQMSDDPLLGYADDELAPTRSEFVADDSSRVIYGRSSAPSRREPKFKLATAAHNTIARAFLDDCQRGNLPVLFCESPTSDPTATMLMVCSPNWARPSKNAVLRDWSPVFEEQDTFYQLEVDAS